VKLTGKAVAVVSLLFAADAASGQQVVSEVPELIVAKATKLPEGPHPAKADDNCSGDFVTPATEAGRHVQQRGWGVLSEVAAGDYQLVSFAGAFIPGTSGSCAIQQGNIGVFEGASLKAIVYTERKSDELIGVLAPLESGNLRLWSGGYLAYPVADISAGSIGLIVGKVAEQDSYCGGMAIVPNIFDLSITDAREKLQGAGWKPVPQPKEEGGQQVQLHDMGITETESCSGTGFAFCRYVYETAAAKLDLRTVGELSLPDYQPGVANYSVTCKGGG
jgi:hypothetical protein